MRIALGALAVVALAVAGAAVAFLAGIDTDGEFLRARLERALSTAFGVPTRIEGPIRFRTGRVATIAADAMVLSDPSAPAGSTFARGVGPSARIDLYALLLQRTVVIEEVTGERLLLALRRDADGKANWAHLFTRSSPSGSTVSFAGIGKLRIARVEGSYRREGEAAAPFAISAFDAALPLDKPAAAAGALQLAGHTIGFDLRTSSLAGLKASGTAIPIKGSLAWRGVDAAIDGRVSNRGTRLETAVQASAVDARAPLAALGIAAQDPGALAVTARLTLTPEAVSADDIAVTLGGSALFGRANIAWGDPGPRIELDLRGERVDATPFLAAASIHDSATAPQRLVEAIETLATGTDAAVRLAIDEFDGLPVDVKSLRLDLRSRERTAGALAEAICVDTPVKVTLDYDARQDRRRLGLRIDSGAASTAALPTRVKPHALTGAATAIRGQWRGEGIDPAAVVSSLQGDLDARGVRWSFARDPGPPISGRFDALRVSVRGSRALAAEAVGRVGASSCSINISGGGLAPLLSGRRWPLQMVARCPGERLSARGWIALAERHPAADVAFDVSTDRKGPAARLIGVPAELPRPIAATGTLTLDEQQARARLSALRLGRTAARSGEIAVPLGRAGMPQLRLALLTLDLNEFSVVGETGEILTRHPLGRRVLRKDLQLPDLDFAVDAELVDVGELRLRNVQVSGVMRDRRLPPAPFRLEWEQLALRGRLGLDFAGPSPHLQLDATSERADLAPLLNRLGIKDVRLTAARLSVTGHASGERLADLLATATLDAAIEQARFDLTQARVHDAASRGTFSATLTAAAGQTTRLAARGKADDRPIDLEASSAGFEAWSRPGAEIPLTLRSTIGDLRVDLDGRFGRDGSGSGRIRLAGARLDELGDLLGLALPEAGGYEASATVALTPGAADVSNLALRFGRSHVEGHLQIGRRNGSRARHVAALRSPVLHLEDIGAAHWLRPRRSNDAAPMTARLRAMAPKIEHGLDLLRTTDIDASIEVDALHSGGEPFAGGRVRASADGGRLRVRLQDVRAQAARVDADIELDASVAQPQYRLHADLQDLDYGPLVRAYDPGSRLAGRLNFLADLATSGSPAELVSQLGGTLDVAVFPQGIESRALDLWGTALITGILRQVDPNARSAVECSVAGFDIVGGVATSNGLFIDTTRMRISGDVQIDLSTREVSGRINASSNEPHLFTFAPTMIVSGPVERPTLAAAPESLLMVPLRFAAPLARFARDWLGGGGRLAESRAGCEEAFDRVRQAHFGAAPLPR